MLLDIFQQLLLFSFTFLRELSHLCLVCLAQLTYDFLMCLCRIFKFLLSLNSGLIRTSLGV